jgi:hypothetical protein
MKNIHKKIMREKDVGFEKNRKTQNGKEIKWGIAIVCRQKRMCCRFKQKKTKRQNENYTMKEKDIRFDRNKKK